MSPDLSQSPHHGQLKVLIIHGLVRPAGEGEAVCDLQPGVGHQTQEGSLGDTTATGARLQLVTVFDQFHDHQAVNLDNLIHNVYVISSQKMKNWLSGVVWSVTKVHNRDVLVIGP